jgi:DNA-binding NtrC family response regulator
MECVRGSQQRVLVFDDDTPASRDDICATLAATLALSCERAPLRSSRDIAEIAPHLLIVIAAGREVRDVAPLLTALRDRAVAPLIVIVDERDAAMLRIAIDAADDFMFAPIRSVELCQRVARFLSASDHDLALVRARLTDDTALNRLVGRDPTFVSAIRLVPRLARTDATVVITGETGTGKELCAGAIHHLSARRDAPFIPVNCGAVPDQLFENELFGHRRGAFTDAHRDQKGLIALAEGGTLFLDEVDALSPAAQAKLLRFLEERSFRPLGSERSDRADVRIIAATNRDPDACMRGGQLREDLYFRLNVLRIHLPALRERPGDIAPLAQSLLARCQHDDTVTARAFSASALRRLAQYHWPGNVRELLNVVQRAAVECDGDTILPEHVHVPVPQTVASAAVDFRTARAAVVAAFERQYVQDLLRKHDGNVTHAAREARQDRRAFGRVIKRHRIDRGAL